MTLKQFAEILNGREYGCEITKEEEALAKELGFVVVFGYSDDNVELRGAIDDEIGCYNGGVLEHDDLPGTIYADWCPEDIDCSWAYGTAIPHEKFYIYEDGELYCVGIVCDINEPNRKSDLVEVVRCKDCKHWIHMEEGMGDCTNGRFHLNGHPDPTMKIDDFCSCGERGDGNG